MSIFANSESDEIRVYTVCKGKKDLQKKEYNIFEKYNLTPLDNMRNCQAFATHIHTFFNQ